MKSSDEKSKFPSKFPTDYVIRLIKSNVPITQIDFSKNQNSVGDQIYSRIRSSGKSVEVVAELAGINKTSLYRIINNGINPQRDVLLRLSRVLEMDIEETNQLLKSGTSATLSGSRARDIVIMEGIIKKYDIAKINDTLIKRGFQGILGNTSR